MKKDRAATWRRMISRDCMIGMLGETRSCGQDMNQASVTCDVLSVLCGDTESRRDLNEFDVDQYRCECDSSRMARMMPDPVSV